MASAGLVSAGQAAAPTAERVEQALREAQAKEPAGFEANYRLGEFLLHTGRVRDGIPYMELALRARPGDAVCAYDLALAYFENHQYDRARERLHLLLGGKESADAHSLLADVEEAGGNFIEAANHYQQAAQIDPTEAHLFDWGSELLKHKSYDAAARIFQQGIKIRPDSFRLHGGLGLTYYAAGRYDPAASELCKAADLNSSAAWLYGFLAKLLNLAPDQMDGMHARIRRFAELQPANPDALYYLALAIRQEKSSPASVSQVETLLKKAVALNSGFADAYYQLGVLEEERSNFASAVHNFERAVALNPNLTSAHYRLSSAYRRNGEQEKTRAELQTYQRLRARDQEEENEARQEVNQFIVTMREEPSGAQP